MARVGLRTVCFGSAAGGIALVEGDAGTDGELEGTSCPLVKEAIAC